MKILFLCGSIEPGKDGVGDYTRRLCGEIMQKGCDVQILSLCDNQSNDFSIEKQEVGGTRIIVKRIGLSTSNTQRYIWTQDVINNFQPDWISLQFVPYSFNPKGLPFCLPLFLRKIKGNFQLQIMFHELWIGMDCHASFKSKCIGLLQKKIILKILKNNPKAIVNTQTDLYQSKLATLGFNAQILPLFSNIVKNRETNFDNLELKFCLFGSIHHGAPVEKFINELKQVVLLSNDKRVLKFVFIGNCGVAIEEWKRVLLSYEINFEVTGFVSDDQISNILSSCQYGISTTPYILSQKSGSLAAMFDHHLPVLSVARNWDVKGYKQHEFINLINFKNQETIKCFFNNEFMILNDNNLEFVAMKFLDGLK